MNTVPQHILYLAIAIAIMMSISVVYMIALKLRFRNRLDCKNINATHVLIADNTGDWILWGGGYSGCLTIDNQFLSITTRDHKTLSFNLNNVSVYRKWKNPILHSFMPYICINDREKEYLLISKDDIFDANAKQKTGLLLRLIQDKLSQRNSTT